MEHCCGCFISKVIYSADFYCNLEEQKKKRKFLSSLSGCQINLLENVFEWHVKQTDTEKHLTALGKIINNSFLSFYFISTSRNLLLKSFAENAFFCVVSNCNFGEETRGLEKKITLVYFRVQRNCSSISICHFIFLHECFLLNSQLYNIEIRVMAYLSVVNAFIISSYCQSDVKMQLIDIYANILFSMSYSKFDIIDVYCVPIFTGDDQCLL